jgi:hypothetical protein
MEVNYGKHRLSLFYRNYKNGLFSAQPGKVIKRKRFCGINCIINKDFYNNDEGLMDF